MNGSMSSDDADAEDREGGRVHLCPMDLRKLQLAFGFDVRTRFEQLRECYQRLGWARDAAWVERRLACL